jgi:hypothetical protein
VSFLILMRNKMIKEMLNKIRYCLVGLSFLLGVQQGYTQVALTKSSGGASWTTLPSMSGTDNQDIRNCGLSGTTLTIGIENGSSQSINLASLRDGTGTDDQNITGCGLSGNNLTIGILNGSSQTVNLSGVKDGTGSDNQNITGCGLSGNNLTIGISNGSSQTVTLPTFSVDGRGIYGGSGSITNYRGVNLNGRSLSVLINNSGSFVAQNIAVVNGRVPIARSSTSYALAMGVDNAGKPSTSTWNISSDDRLKNIIGEYSKGLDEIIQLNTIRYYYKDTEDYKFNDDTKKTMSYGFIAQ